MQFQTFFRGTAVCSLLFISSVSAQPSDPKLDLSSVTDSDLRTMIVHFERTTCFGTCPAYTITISGDGRLEYNGKLHVTEKGLREGHLETDQVKSLLKEFTTAKFLAISEDYSEKNCKRYCTDMATVVTELSVKGTSHRVKHYYGCGGAPKALFDLESAIDKLANVERWIGDVSKAGPFGTTCMDGR
jgi:Domain of unknown function (DUF6438)